MKKTTNSIQTPKTLDEALNQARNDRENEYQILKDFIAQKFAVAYLRAKDEQILLVLSLLFTQLTTRSDDSEFKEPTGRL